MYRSDNLLHTQTHHCLQKKIDVDEDVKLKEEKLKNAKYKKRWTWTEKRPKNTHIYIGFGNTNIIRKYQKNL